eukprot:8561807-Pyramimonas_sp.AAC.1
MLSAVGLCCGGLAPGPSSSAGPAAGSAQSPGGGGSWGLPKTAESARSVAGISSSSPSSLAARPGTFASPARNPASFAPRGLSAPAAVEVSPSGLAGATSLGPSRCAGGRPAALPG